MSDKLKEIRLKIAKLEKEAKELKQLKLDCNDAKKFQRKIVESRFD